MVTIVNNFSDIALCVQKLYEENERLTKENKRLSNRVNKLLKKVKTLKVKTSPLDSKVLETNWSIVSREIQEK